MKFKIISVNIEGNRHLEERVLPFLQKEAADVVCLQEVFEQDVELLKAAAGLREASFAPMSRVDEANPHLPARGVLGVAILANQLVEVEPIYYVGDDSSLPPFFENQNPNSLNRVVLKVTAKIEDDLVKVATTHFVWSQAGEVTALQLESFDQLKQILKQWPELILCGDFNTPRGKQIYDELSRIYQDNIPSKITTTIDKNLHKSGADIQLVVDGMFSSDAYSFGQVRVVSGVSDHKAVVGEVEKHEKDS